MLPPPELGQTTTACPGRRCGLAMSASGSVAYAGPTMKTSSAPSIAAPASWPAYASGAKPEKDAGGVDAAGGGGRLAVGGEALGAVEADLMPVLRVVEGDRA